VLGWRGVFIFFGLLVGNGWLWCWAWDIPGTISSLVLCNYVFYKGLMWKHGIKKLSPIRLSHG
jgi:hypothetical protein